MCAGMCVRMSMGCERGYVCAHRYMYDHEYVCMRMGMLFVR